MNLVVNGFQNRDEQQGAQAKALLNSYFYTEHSTQIATNTHSASGTFIHALYEAHQPLLDTKLAKIPPDDTCVSLPDQ